MISENMVTSSLPPNTKNRSLNFTKLWSVLGVGDSPYGSSITLNDSITIWWLPLICLDIELKYVIEVFTTLPSVSSKYVNRILISCTLSPWPGSWQYGYHNWNNFLPLLGSYNYHLNNCLLVENSKRSLVLVSESAPPKRYKLPLHSTTVCL